MKRFSIFLLLLIIGCGKGEEQTPPQPPQPPPEPIAQTPFGGVDEIKGYLEKINPYIQQVGQLQAQVDQVKGSSGQFTSQNMAAAIELALPPLQKARDEFSRIHPPPGLASFHADIEKLMDTRLEAYRMILDGWKQEQRTKITDWHQKAEEQFHKANDQIVQLNKQMDRINQALAKAATAPQVASP